MLHRTACHACLLQQPNIEKSESEFHFGTTYAVAVVATWRIGAKLPCVAVCTCRVPRTCRGVKKFRFSMGTISFIFRSQKTISISVSRLNSTLVSIINVHMKYARSSSKDNFPLCTSLLWTMTVKVVRGQK